MHFALLIIWMLRDVEPYGGDHNFALYIIRFSSPNPKFNLSFCIVNYEFCIINWAQCFIFFVFDAMRRSARCEEKPGASHRDGRRCALRRASLCEAISRSPKKNRLLWGVRRLSTQEKRLDGRGENCITQSRRCVANATIGQPQEEPCRQHRK